MKKYLVTFLIMAFVMGIAGTALADVNPFTDVPQGHWAYAAVNKLYQAGIIDGYNDATFMGDKNISRYEMAQMVAKAMANSDNASAENKAIIDKLAVEFASELNTLGVRVSKLETKTNIGLTYESRIRFADDSNKVASMQGSNNFDFRQRVSFAGAVNDKTSFGARLETGNVSFGSGSSAAAAFDRMYFTFSNVIFDQDTIGRFSTNGVTNGLLSSRTGNNDGIKVVSKLGDAAKFTAMYYDVKPYDNLESDGKTASGTGSNEIGLANIDFKVGDASNINIGYENAHLSYMDKWPTVSAYTAEKSHSYDLGGYTKLGNVYLTGEYVKTTAVVDNVSGNGKAIALQLTNGVTPSFYPVYNIVDPTKEHTDAFAISYRKIDGYSVPFVSGFKGADPIAGVVGGKNNSLAQDDNVKGYYFAYQNVLSKGVVLTFEYQDLKQVVGTAKDSMYNANLQFFF